MRLRPARPIADSPRLHFWGFFHRHTSQEFWLFMEKRWLVFFLIFAATFLVFSMREAAIRSDRLEAERLAQIHAASQRAAESPELATEDEPTSSTVKVANPAKPPRIEVDISDSPIQVVENGFVRVEFAEVGAVPVSWQILPSKHMTGIFDDIKKTTTTLDLIPQVARNSEREYPLQFEGRAVDSFNNEKHEVTRESTKDGTVIKFTSPVVDDMQVTRTYRFEPDSYLVTLEIQIRNGSARSPIGDPDRGWGLGWQGGFAQPHELASGERPPSMLAAVGDEVRFKSLDADDDPESYDNNVFWCGQSDKYFTALVMPGPQNQPNLIEMAVRKRNISDEYLMSKKVRPPQSVSLLNSPVELQPNQTLTASYSLFVGPKEYDLMRKLKVPMAADAPPPSEAVFGQIFWGKGWIRPISLLLLKGLHWLANHLKNWGLAIIALVLIVKTILLPLSQWAIKNQARTMAEQGRIKPFLDKINERYKNDPTKRSQEMMKLYREHNINPLGMLRGCFPVLLQMPIFIALYVVLGEAIELRGQNFLWMQDLSGPDRLIRFPFTIPFLGWNSFNLLPLLMAFTQYVSSKMMSANITDPTQKQVMVMMPIIFTIFMYNFPSGLMVYWVVQNVWTIGHTWLTKRYVATHPAGESSAEVVTATPVRR